uniref:Charged multivesicular body protein 7 n=1 Tax=Aceria tosichella TaxID=561515 RepID=A0A6G1S6W6_9ACAR
MSIPDSHLRSLLSPARSGTFFAPFRSRSANPDGFDSKMKLWISAIEEWAVAHKKVTVTINDIHQKFVSDSGIRPDKECIRLVMSEMKRRSRIVPLNSLRGSKFWSNTSSQTLIDNYIDPKGWLGWSVKKLVYTPATWAVSAFINTGDQCYSDLTDMSITDTMKFVCQKSLHELSQRLYDELIRISKAEKQHCFEWQHLLELIMGNINAIIDERNGRDLMEVLDILMEYLALHKRVSMQEDNDTKLVKVISHEDINDVDVDITRKDIAMARLLKAKELLTANADEYHAQAQRAKQEAIECYSKKEVAKAKSLLRSHKRLMTCAEQKEIQLANVEDMLEQLEGTSSNMMILKAYKDGAEALKIANTKLDSNVTILDDVYDATAEARHLNDEMTRMLNDISRVNLQNISTSDLEAELNQYIADSVSQDQAVTNAATSTNKPQTDQETREQHNVSVDDLEEQLNNLVVCQHPIIETSDRQQVRESTPKKSTVQATFA